jgi:hypothetical protein
MKLNITLPIIPFPKENDKDLNPEVLITEEVDLNNPDPEPTTFYTIDAISPFRTPYGDYTIVHSGGQEFLCINSYENLWDKLNIIYQAGK